MSWLAPVWAWLGYTSDSDTLSDSDSSSDYATESDSETDDDAFEVDKLTYAQAVAPEDAVLRWEIPASGSHEK